MKVGQSHHRSVQAPPKPPPQQQRKQRAQAQRQTGHDTRDRFERSRQQSTNTARQAAQQQKSTRQSGLLQQMKQKAMNGAAALRKRLQGQTTQDKQLQQLRHQTTAQLKQLKNDQTLDDAQRAQKASAIIQNHFEQARKLGAGYQATGSGESVTQLAARDGGRYRVNLGSDGKFDCMEASVEAQKLFSKAGIDTRLDVVKNADGSNHALLDMQGRRFDASAALQGKSAFESADDRPTVASLSQAQVKEIFHHGGSEAQAVDEAQRLGVSAAASVQANGNVSGPQVNPDKVGVALNDSPENLLAKLPEISALGVKGARITLNTDNFHPEDEANLASWQKTLTAYKEKGIDVVLNMPRETIDGYPDPVNKDYDPAKDGGYSISDTQPAQWEQQFKAYEQKYLGALKTLNDRFASKGLVSGFEIWNEPDEQNNRPPQDPKHPRDQDTGYEPGLPAHSFAQLLKDAYAVVHGAGADPDTHPAGPRIISGGLDSGNSAWLTDAVKATDGKLYADELGLHPYGKRPSEAYDAANPGQWFGTFDGIVHDYASFNRPISFTETGDRRGHPDYIPEAAKAVNGLNGDADGTPAVHRSYFFLDDPYDGGFGMVDTNKDTGQREVRQNYNDLKKLLH